MARYDILISLDQANLPRGHSRETRMALTTALITGASSGIGYELSKVMAEHGHDLVLVARRKDNLDTLANYLRREYRVSVTVLAEDLSDPGAAERIYQTLHNEHIPVDILINNAGVGTWGRFSEQNYADLTAMIQLNILALTQLSRLFAVDMVRRGLGKIVNIASVAGYLPGPYMAVYNASKAYVVSFSEALRVELKGTGISVTAVCPGPTSSEFHHHAGTVDIPALRKMPMLGSGQVARRTYRAMKKHRAVYIPGRTNRLLVWLLNVIPTRLVSWVAARVMKPQQQP
jgi:short-subunit dehydrogenase